MMKKTSSDIKIFVSCHKPTEFIKNKLFVPIQVGTGLKGHQTIPHVLHDNEGDNITMSNSRYCELTAQYWVWKNAQADYCGFFHYRRYLAFKDCGQQPDVWGNIVDPYLTDAAISKYGLDEDTIAKMVQKYDILIAEKKDILAMPEMGHNLREQFSSNRTLHDQDIQIMLDVIKERHPKFLPYAKQFLNGHTAYFCNMFIMKKPIFDKYCEWLFDIVDECDKRIDYTNYSIEAIRTPGHLAERLLNIYILYLQDKCDYTYKELPTILFLNTDPQQDLQPAFQQNNTPIVFAAGDSYITHLATTLTSIQKNSSKAKNYDIIVLHKDITPAHQVKLQNLLSTNKNFSLRFLDLGRYQEQFTHLWTYGHFGMETWYRLLLPELLPKYKKIIYLDSDLVVETDIAKMYQTKLSNNLLAACRDADTAGLYNGYLPDKKTYIDNVLKLDNPYDYFQAGVLIMNLELFRKTYSTADVLHLASSRKWDLLDQDVLNFLAKGKVTYLDMAWNVMMDWGGIRIKDIIARAPKALNEDYQKARRSPYIIHYAGPEKPWYNPGCDFASNYWRYSRLTSFYESDLQNLQHSIINDENTLKHLAKKLLPSSSRRGKAARKLFARLH